MAISMIITFLSIMFFVISGIVPIVMRYNKQVKINGKIAEISLEEQLRFSRLYSTSAFTVACLIFVGSVLMITSIVTGYNEDSITKAYIGFMCVPSLLNATKGYDKEIKSFEKQIKDKKVAIK